MIHEYLKNGFKKLEKYSMFDSILIAGDLNIHFNLINKNSFITKIYELFLSNGFKQRVSGFTYKSSNRLIDLVFCNTKIITNIEITKNLNQNCDHKGIYLEINVEKQETDSKKYKTIIDFNEKLNQSLYDIDSNQIYSEDKNINQIFRTIETKFSEVFDKNINTKQIILKNTKFPKHIKKLVLKKRKILKKLKNDSNFLKTYNELSLEIKDRIEEYESNKINKLIQKSENL